MYKYVYFNVTVQNRLGYLTLFKHHLNAKQRVTGCLPFSVQGNTKYDIPYDLS